MLDRLPVRFGTRLDWTLTDKLVVAVADVKSAVYLRLAIGGSRLTGVDGRPAWEQHEVLISLCERAEGERLLRENFPADAGWSSIIVISARSDAARQAFDDAYRVVMGRHGDGAAAPRP